MSVADDHAAIRALDGSATEDHGPVRRETPSTYYDETVRIPGQGDAPNRCRGMKPVGYCNEGHVVLGRSSCGTRYCPEHWRDWIEDAVASAVARLAAYRQAAEGAGKRMVHVVASPPQDRRYSQRALWETRTEAYDALEAAGVRGGTVVTHPYRTNDEAEALYPDGAEAEGVGRWRFLREWTDGWDDLKGYVEAAPHYHALAPAEDVDGEAAPPGWIVKRIRSMDRFYLRDTEAYRDMARTVYYVCTHGGVQQGRAMTTYFGEVHPAAFDPEEELTAAEWDRIKREAERAVLTEPGALEGEGTEGPEECPHDDCEADVRDLRYLQEALADEAWVASIRAHPDGGRRLAELRGALAYWRDLTDRPPPHARADPDGFRTWLRRRGQVRAPTPVETPTQQVGLSTAVMGS
jgi:hypothetical protein